MDFLIVGLGGFFGAMARYAIYLAERAWISSAYPLATFVVNVIACFLAGALVGAIEMKAPLSPQWVLACSMGFLGAFSTFSTFAVENLALVRQEQLTAAAFNIVLSLLFGIVAVVVGRSGVILALR